MELPFFKVIQDALSFKEKCSCSNESDHQQEAEGVIDHQ
jgi:hypothetical protein